MAFDFIIKEFEWILVNDSNEEEMFETILIMVLQIF